MFALKEQKTRDKTMGKPISKGRLRDDTARIVAKIHKVSVRYVQLVRDGKRENEAIMATLVEFGLGKTNLIKTLEALVHITANPKKYAREKN
jgi:hypothetical protein